MATQTLIFGIQLAPGDEPRAIEQINGDILLPAAGRPTLEKALLMAEEALPPDCAAQLQALQDARRLLGIARPDRKQDALQANLLKVAPL